MIRVTLADGASEYLGREIEPRRAHETLYDFMLRATHETTLDVRALRALLDGHVKALANERASVLRQRRMLLVGQSIISALICVALVRPDTLEDALILGAPVAIMTAGAGLMLARSTRSFDRLFVRLTRRWRR